MSKDISGFSDNLGRALGLERGLKNRHIQLISIGGIIGTGLFMGSGKSIHQAGPSILLSYLLVGVVIYLLARALGELLMSNLKYHSYIDFVHEYLGRKHAFATGWTYWFCWIVLGMTDLTATGMYMQKWLPDLPQYLPCIVALIVLVLVNISAVKHFGEMEFWFALIKVIAVIALIIIGIVMIFVNWGNAESSVSIANLWSWDASGNYTDNFFTGFFPNGIIGFLLSFQMATFAFSGVEVIGIMAGETKDPEKTLPKAINNVPIRVGIFYIGALFIIMCIEPWTSFEANRSPFVEVFEQAGIFVAATVVNFVVLTAAASACNSSIYSTSRMLMSLGNQQNAPQKVTQLNKHSVPIIAILSSAVVILAAVIINIFFPSDAFNILSSLATICFLFVWVIIILTHMKFRKTVQNANALKFKSPFYPYSDYIILGFIVLVTVIMFFVTDTLIALLCLPFWLGALYLIYHFKYGRTPVDDQESANV